MNSKYKFGRWKNLSSLFFALSFILCLITSVTSQLVATEIEALKTFYLETGGPDSWKIKWNLDTGNHCRWRGISCDSSGSRVSEM